jgi:predicted dehydrogenase
VALPHAQSVADMPAAEGKKVALIAGRTADNPALLEAVVAKGCGTVYLEKPGAPTVAELETMAAFATAHGAKVGK